MTRPSRVGDLMSTALVFVRDTDTIALARREMRRAGIHHLPVVDEHQNLIGVISRTDLTEGRSRPGRRQRIGEIMSRAVVTVTPETSITLASELMLDHVFRSLPVVGSDGQLIGILTETDVLRGMRVLSVLPGPWNLGGDPRPQPIEKSQNLRALRPGAMPELASALAGDLTSGPRRTTRTGRCVLASTSWLTEPRARRSRAPFP